MTRTEITDNAATFGEKYGAGMKRSAFSNAKETARSAVNFFKATLNENSSTTPEDANLALCTAIYFRCLYDFAELSELTAKQDWENANDTVEIVWRTLCDCKERFEFVDGLFTGNGPKRIRHKLSELLEFFFARYGNGVYSSPELLIDHSICSICNRDIRGCDHRPGKLYNGKLCASLPRGISMESSSMVDIPADPRCRIWPWQIKDDNTGRILLLSLFRIDDFMEKENWS